MDTSEFTDEQIDALQALADGYNDQSVSRRDVMKLVGAGGVGALLGGGGMASATEPASAGTQQVGALGSPGNPIDLDAVEDIYGPGGQGSGDAVNFEAVNTGEHVTKTNPHANVKAHGAVGDGATDDTQAIQDARDAISAGESVFFPPGDYLVSSAIDRKGRLFVGEGRFASTVVAATGGAWDSGGHSEATAVLYDRERDNCEVRNLGVDCNGEDAAGIAFFGGDGLAAVNNYVVNSADGGIQFWGNDQTGVVPCENGVMNGNIVKSCEWNYIFDGLMDNCEMAGNVSLTPTARHVSVDAGPAADVGSTHALQVGSMACMGSGTGFSEAVKVNGSYCNVTDVHIYDVDGVGILHTGNGHVSDCTVHVADTAFVVDGTADGFQLTDCTALNTTTGLQTINSPNAPKITDLSIRDATTYTDISGYADDWVLKHIWDENGNRIEPTYFKGEATVTSGSTTASFNHNLVEAPNKEDIHITPENPWGNATQFWIGGPTTAKFDVALDQDPGQDVTFRAECDLSD